MVIITPFPEEDLPLLWKWLKEFQHQTIDDYSPKSVEQLAEKCAKDHENGARSCGILRDGKTVGAVWCENMGDGLGAGHLVFDREAPLTTCEKLESVKMCLRVIFEGYRKVCWAFFADNRAFRIFLKKLGAQIEGCLKQNTRRNQELVDVMLMASFPESLK